jgi:hypothetical protein
MGFQHIGNTPIEAIDHVVGVQSWPVDVLADYARLVELLTEHGPSLRLLHSRAFGDGLFELRPRGRSGIGRAFYCFLLGNPSSTPTDVSC